MQNHKYSIDTVVGLRSQLNSLQSQLDTLKNQRVVTLPYSKSTGLPAEAIHGQVYFDENNDEWLYGLDDAWHKTTPVISTGGDYVKLDEIDVGYVYDGVIEFDSIDQTYRHLVIELSVCGGTGYTLLRMDWNSAENNYYQYQNLFVSTADGLNIYQGTDYAINFSNGDMSDPLPGFALPEGLDDKATYTIKIPYYSKINPDGSITRTTEWVGGGFSVDGGNSYIHSSGSAGYLGSDEFHRISDPIASIRIWADNYTNIGGGFSSRGSQGLGPDSVGSLYGIK